MLLGKILLLRFKFPVSNFSFTLHVWPTTEWFCRERLGKFCRDASQPRCSTLFTTGRRKANLSPSLESKEINAKNNFIGQNVSSELLDFWDIFVIICLLLSSSAPTSSSSFRWKRSLASNFAAGGKVSTFLYVWKDSFLLWEKTVPWTVLSVRIYYFCIQCIAN